MNHRQIRIVLSSVLAVAALSAMVPSVRAEPPDSAKAQMSALEKRVSALELRKEAETTTPAVASAPRRKATEAFRSSAIDVERYLQYPAQ
jgi:hypothetical protein